MYPLPLHRPAHLRTGLALLLTLARCLQGFSAGGEYAGDYADGVVKPNIGVDYAPTGLWDGLLGEAVPAEGNPELALKLIADSGEAFPQPFVIDYAQSETNDKAAASLVASLLGSGTGSGGAGAPASQSGFIVRRTRHGPATGGRPTFSATG